MRREHEITRPSRDRRTRPLAAAAALLLVGASLGLTRSQKVSNVADPAPAHPPVTVVDTITPAMIALGDDIFHGRKSGAICASCHGKGGKGIAGMGPDLTDGVWLHGDGSLPFLESIITSGVMKPKAGGAIMPPSGGTPLKPDQLKAVAAYVYSLR